LGGTDEGSEGNWRWITGEPWGYNRWTPGNPNNAPWEGISSQDYLWSGFAYKQLWDDTDNTARGGSISDYLLEKESTIDLEVESYFGIRGLPWSDLHATIMQVAQARAQNGAEQMRLQMAADLNSTNIVNMEQALSRIQDVDIAQTASDLARTKVLIDAGTAMSAQANTSQQSILRLIDSGRF
jgi:hypothetical protein